MPIGISIRPWRTWLSDKNYNEQFSLEKHRLGVVKVDRRMTIPEMKEQEDGKVSEKS